MPAAVPRQPARRTAKAVAAPTATRAAAGRGARRQLAGSRVTAARLIHAVCASTPAATGSITVPPRGRDRRGPRSGRGTALCLVRFDDAHIGLVFPGPDAVIGHPRTCPGRSLSQAMQTSTRCCDDAGMAALTPEEIAAKIATAESGLAAATSQYDRNVFALIRDEYKRYAAERANEIAKQAAAVSSSAS
jgi:hypothetical protein